jgi:hypothetical protein
MRNNCPGFMNAELNTSITAKAARRAAWLCVVAGTLLTMAAASVWAAPKAAAPNPAAPKPVPEVVIPKSVFVDRPDFGRDPFFPKSTRRGQVVATNPVIQPVGNFDSIALKGISVNNEKRLAIVNNKTFEVGEEGEVPVGAQRVKVKIIEIREKSAVISVNGVSKELFLGSKF